ncbi:MAG TPA: hypothetical protein VFL54_09775, partial [Gammaproteobacteria bacterium]|nr:hypothetical protein [Gammaproteobacteria bacterium]
MKIWSGFSRDLFLVIPARPPRMAEVPKMQILSFASSDFKLSGVEKFLRFEGCRIFNQGPEGSEVFAH